MFLRGFERVKAGKRHVYYALVESVRTEDGPRQRIVAKLGELTPDDQRRWERIALFDAREASASQLSLFPEAEDREPGLDVVRVILDKVQWTNARPFGDVWVGLKLWRLLGLDEITRRHLEAGRQTVAPATMVAIEVISRLCIGQGGPTSELALAEDGYRRTALEDLLGVPDKHVTKDRLYRTLDALVKAKGAIEAELKNRLGSLFDLTYDLLLCDLTSTFFEGLAEDNELAARGHSRDHRSDCKQVVLALVVTPEGFPLYHEIFAGNTNDAAAFPQLLESLEHRFGSAERVWVLDRGIATPANLAVLKERKQSYLVGTPRSQLKEFEAELSTSDWSEVREHVEVKCVQREGQSYVLARSTQRRAKERAIRRRQLLGMHRDLKKLEETVASGRLKDADTARERVGRLRERWPGAGRYLHIEVEREAGGQAKRVSFRYDRRRLLRDLARDGAYLLRSNQTQWTPHQLWCTYMQLATAEDAFRTMKSHQFLRPVWHRYENRVKAHIFVCVLAYTLWKALDQLLRNAGLMTLIRKPDLDRPRTSPRDRRMTPFAALKLLHDIPIGDILLETVDGRYLRLRRVARPNEDQARLLAGLGLTLPERLCPDVEAMPSAPPQAEPAREGAEAEDVVKTLPPE